MSDVITHSISILVRDYECDLQGRVNNAIYLNYFEHARNSLLVAKNTSLRDMHNAGFDPVIVRAEVDFLRPIYPHTRVKIFTSIKVKGSYKMLFQQDMRQEDSYLTIAKGLFTCAIVYEQKPIKIVESPLSQIVSTQA